MKISLIMKTYTVGEIFFWVQGESMVILDYTGAFILKLIENKFGSHTVLSELALYWSALYWCSLVQGHFSLDRDNVTEHFW